jgi:hypothetical protein
MHEFCCCEALKVFKVIYEKKCEKGVKRFDLKRFENLSEKDLKKKKNKPKPKPHPHPAQGHPLSFPFLPRPSVFSGPSIPVGPRPFSLSPAS